MSAKKHVVIVGAGPAGIFTALELSKNNSVQVTIIDKGKDLDKRLKSSADGIYCGWGGAGAFSDGKLNFSTETGGWLSDYIDEKDLSKIIEKVDNIFLKYGAPEKMYGVDEDRILKI
ncbi:MAG: FAD-dependent oxidoreductase, partial [Candidatus Micrarchaeia archaeon]